MFPPTPCQILHGILAALGRWRFADQLPQPSRMYSTRVAAESCQIACVSDARGGPFTVAFRCGEAFSSSCLPGGILVVSASQVVFCMLAALMVAAVTWTMTRVKLVPRGR